MKWLREEEYKDAKEEMDDLNGKVHGVTKKIMWMPDVMADVGNTFMSAMGMGMG